MLDSRKPVYVNWRRKKTEDKVIGDNEEKCVSLLCWWF
jgi:hypothetical protein